MSQRADRGKEKEGKSDERKKGKQAIKRLWEEGREIRKSE